MRQKICSSKEAVIPLQMDPVDRNLLPTKIHPTLTSDRPKTLKGDFQIYNAAFIIKTQMLRL
jgi:hypothetical protein